MQKRLTAFIKQWRSVLIVTPAVSTLLIALRLAGWLQLWELVALDTFFRLRPPETRDSRIVIVKIAESDIRKLGQWPMSDAVMAKLIKKIRKQQPRAIGLDIYRDLKVEPGHQELVKVFQTTPNLVGIKKVSGGQGGLAVNPSPVLNKLGKVAASDLVIDADGKVRRGLVFLESEAGEVVPSLSLKLALIYLKAEGITPKNAAVNPEYLQLNQAVFERFRANDGSYVNTDDRGYQILVNFKRPQSAFLSISLTDVLENRIPANLLRDRIVLIGATAESLHDFFYTPYDGGAQITTLGTSGVEIHANLTSQIISAALENRPLIKVWPEAFEWLWIVFWSTTGAAITWQWRRSIGVNKFSVKKVSILFLLISGIVSISYILFLWSWWIPLIPALLGLTGSVVGVTAFIAHHAEKIRQTCGRYLSDSVVANLLENPAELKLGGDRKKITVLVSDLRGFTALSERLSPEDGVKIINIYLKEMTEVITAFHGNINEFMGDGIMVIFGAPNSKEDDAKRSVACAVAMQLAMTRVNQKINNLGFLIELEMGIGINTGIALVGNIGSEQRTKYTAVGSEVNLAFRIETYTKSSEILISESTLDEVKEIAKIDSKKEVRPKGVNQSINIYEIGGIGGEYNLFLIKEEPVFLPLREVIPLQFTALYGKHISDTSYQGCLCEISAKQALIKVMDSECLALPLPLDNIKLNLLNANNLTEFGEDIYAKVLEKPANENCFYVHFTFLPPAVKLRLETIYKSVGIPREEDFY